MKKSILIRGHQGDVQFKQIEVLPDNLVSVKGNIIVDGSTVGNSHIITGDVKLFKDDTYQYMVVGSKKARLQHIKSCKLSKEVLVSTKELPVADHKSILLPKGIYLVGIHKRFNPFSKIFEKVID